MANKRTKNMRAQRQIDGPRRRGTYRRQNDCPLANVGPPWRKMRRPGEEEDEGKQDARGTEGIFKKMEAIELRAGQSQTSTYLSWTVKLTGRDQKAKPRSVTHKAEKNQEIGPPPRRGCQTTTNKPYEGVRIKSWVIKDARKNSMRKNVKSRLGGRGKNGRSVGSTTQQNFKSWCKLITGPKAARERASNQQQLSRKKKKQASAIQGMVA